MFSIFTHVMKRAAWHRQRAWVTCALTRWLQFGEISPGNKQSWESFPRSYVACVESAWKQWAPIISRACRAAYCRSDAIMSAKKWRSSQEQLKEELSHLLHPPGLGPLQINSPPLSPEVLNPPFVKGTFVIGNSKSLRVLNVSTL